MTETSWVDEEYRTSDLWSVEKSITPPGDAEQLAKWEQAVAVLKDLGKLAETLHNDPLILALTDALIRAEEEQARIEDRLSRPEGEDLHPRERHRLKGLLHRTDALGQAHQVVTDSWREDTEARDRTLAILGELHQEAAEAFARYRSEVGIPR